MKLIRLKGKFSQLVTIVDDDVYAWAKYWNWHGVLHKQGKNVYVQGNRAGVLPKHQYLHRLVLGVVDSYIKCDHINRDTLDNQRENLRIVTLSDNGKNAYWTHGRSRYKGVNFHKKVGKWEARIMRPDKVRKHLGYHESEAAAAMAYDDAAARYYGQNALLNFKRDNHMYLFEP